MADSGRLICPSSNCRAEFEFEDENCVKCGLPLRGLARLSAHPSRLFNMGLAAARDGQAGRARDLFAAVVYWCPLDIEARNAMAMACLASGDAGEAKRQWETVLTQSPSDPVATGGLAQINSASQAMGNVEKKVGDSKVKIGRSKKKRKK